MGMLGLLASNGNKQAYGSGIDVESVEGKGTVFMMRIPSKLPAMV
jgi:hypothetical protein